MSQAFLKSGPSILAGLHLQHAFEMQHSPLDCRSIIDTYTLRGGDFGITERHLRAACGLQRKPDAAGKDVAGTQANTVLPKGVDLSITPEDPQETESNSGMSRMKKDLVLWMHKEKKDSLTFAYFRTVASGSF